MITFMQNDEIEFSTEKSYDNECSRSTKYKIMKTKYALTVKNRAMHFLPCFNK